MVGELGGGGPDSLACSTGSDGKSTFSNDSRLSMTNPHQCPHPPASNRIVLSTHVKSSMEASLEWSMEALELAAVHSSAMVCQFDKNCLSPKRERNSVTFSNRTSF